MQVGQGLVLSLSSREHCWHESGSVSGFGVWYAISLNRYDMARYIRDGERSCCAQWLLLYLVKISLSSTTKVSGEQVTKTSFPIVKVGKVQTFLS